MKRKLLILIIAISLLPMILFFVTLKSKKGENDVVIPASSQEEEDEPLVFAGKIKSENEVELRFQTSGRLSWVGVKKGDYVKKWQTIASLDQRQLRKEVEKEMNDYLNERWDFEQTQDDYKETKERHLLTDSIRRILDKSQFDLNSSVLDYEIDRITLEYANLFTPIEGIVTEVDQPIAGINITPATATFTVSDPANLYFEVEIEEEEIGRVKEGMKGKIILDAYPEKEFDTKVISIDFAPIAGESNTVYAAKLDLPENDNLQFRLEMGGEVELQTND